MFNIFSFVFSQVSCAQFNSTSCRGLASEPETRVPSVRWLQEEKPQLRTVCRSAALVTELKTAVAAGSSVQRMPQH